MQQEQQRQEQALPELLKYEQCVRSHGVPNFTSAWAARARRP